MNVALITRAARMQVPVSVWVSGLWLRIGMAGALLAGYGVTVMLDGAVTPGIGIVVAGIALSFVGFRRSSSALERGPRPAKVAPVRRRAPRVEPA